MAGLKLLSDLRSFHDVSGLGVATAVPELG